jgi:peptidoglycan/xylan/chitin deacetylase (PgdA/CDA1 family)
MLAVTFDDGYRDTMHDAAQIAATNDWPMTFYLPTGTVDRSATYWNLELERIVATTTSPTPFVVMVGGAPVSIDCNDIDATLTSIEHRVAHLPTPEIDAIIDELRDQCQPHRAPTPPSAAEPFEVATWDEVAKLAGDARLTFGAHTVTHPRLSELDEAAIRTELIASADAIEQHTGQPVRHFCYPFGSEAAIGTVAPRIAAERFDSAVVMGRGRIHNSSNLMLLPRVPLYEADAPATAQLKVALAK